MNAVSFVTFLLYLLLNYSVSTKCTDSTRKDGIVKPHIILIVADDLGFNDVPWHNNRVIAPHLKQLADDGVILEQSYVLPICSPTRSALLTGIYPFAIGRQGEVIWPLTPTGLTTDAYIIPQLLKPLGYSTHAVGKWHLGFCNWKYTPTERGFDTFRGYYTGSEDYFTHRRTWENLKEIPEYGGVLKQDDGDIYSNKIQRDDPTYPMGYDFRDNRDPYLNASGLYSTYEFASHVETLLGTSSPDVPKFVYMAFQSVHAPLQVPENYTDLYRNITDKKRRTYLGMVTAMDDAVGRIVKTLKDTGHYNNSIIVFTTDNGGPTVYGGNNWPLRGNKSTLWEGGTRGAAFVHSPFLVNKGSISNNMIHVTDWMSTIVNLAGGLPPSMIDSIDQWEAINGRAPSPRNEIVYNLNKNEKTGVRAAIRVGDYKLIIGDPGPGEWIPPPENRTTKYGVSQNLYDSKAEKSQTNEFHKFIHTLANRCKTTRCFKKVIKILERNHNKQNKRWMKKEKIEMKNFRRHILASTREFSKNINKEEEFKFLPSVTGHSTNRSLLNEIMPDEFAVHFIQYEEKNNTEPIQHAQIDSHLKDCIFCTSSNTRLYNLIDDPEERVNLAKERKDKVIELTKHLLAYRKRYVPPDEPKSDQRGDPKYWNGVWSPGWC